MYWFWLHISQLVVSNCFHLLHLSFLGFILLTLCYFFFLFSLHFLQIIIIASFELSYCYYLNS